MNGRRRERSLKVRLEHVTHRFGETAAVDDVSLEVRPGEFMTLLGPSGSGKTTLLRIVGGLIEAAAGRIWIGERDVTNLPAESRDIGFVFQNYALFPHLDVRENVAFALRLRKVAAPEIARRVDEALALVQLMAFGSRRPAELSGGQQQRVALARAIVFHPTILLMDEPLGALDKRLRQDVGLELRRLQRELGITAIYVTHDQEEAFTLSDRIAIMNRGRLRQVADPATVYRRPADAFTAAFVGDLNSFEGELTQAENSEVVFRTGDGLHIRAAAPAGNITGKAGLGIRPEDVAIGDAAPLDNRFPALVKAVIFLGGYYRIVLELEGGRTAIADLRDKGPPPPEGARVTIGWSAADCLIFPIVAAEPE